MNSSIFRKMFIGFAAIAVLLSLLVFTIFNFFNTFYAHSQWAAHSLQVRAHIESLRANLYRSESARRGYVITAEEVRLDEFSNSSREVDYELSVLRNLTGDNQSQQDRLSKIAPLVQNQLEFSRAVISARKESAVSAVNLTLTNRGVELMSDIQALIMQMTEEEGELLRERSSRVNGSFKYLSGVFVFLTLFIIGVIFFLSFLLWRNAGFSVVAYQQLSKIHRTINGERDMLLGAEMEKVRAELEIARKNIAATVGLIQEQAVK